MPRIETVAADSPFAERLRVGLGYPLRRAALATCVALALAQWAATWRYAADCMLRTARGYANRPEMGALAAQPRQMAGMA